jgi:hypothetical protein
MAGHATGHSDEATSRITMSNERFAALRWREAHCSLSGRRCARNTIGALSDVLEAMETHIHSELAKLRAERRGESS